MKDRLNNALAVVKSQAEDAGLWFIAKTATEAYLQQELRKLHAAVEGRSPQRCAEKFLMEKARQA